MALKRAALLLALLAPPCAAADSVLLVGWDGADRRVVERLFAAGRLPSLRRLVGEGRPVRLDATTGTTQTKPGWVEILTGYAAPRANVRSNKDYGPVPAGWTVFERAKSSLGPDVAAIFLASKHSNLGMRGPHEICLNARTRDAVTRNATNYQYRDKFTGQTLDGKAPDWVLREGEPFHHAAPSLDAPRLGLGQAARVYAAAEGEFERVGSRRFVAFVHFAEPDEAGHRSGVGSVEYEAALVEADRWLGRLLDLLARRGLAARTAVFVASDHGIDDAGLQHDSAPNAFLASNLPVRDGDRKDVAPTLYAAVGLAGADWSPALDGRSLLDAGAAAPASTAPARGALCPDCNVLVVSVTALRADHMGTYGYARPTTPRLDEYARGAWVFETAYAHASWTLPSATSLMTGLYPYTHGVWKRMFENTLHPEDRTLAELLSARGWKTASFGGGLDYHPRFTYLRGFQTRPENPHYTPFSTTAAQAEKWLAAHGRERFFLVVQGYDAHCPFKTDAPYRGMFADPAWKSPGLDVDRCVRGFRRREGSYKAYYAGHCPRLLNQDQDATCPQGDAVALTDGDIRFIEASYDETLRQADERVGRLLASLPPDVSSRTIVVFTSEHGEMFAEHGRFGRAGTRRGAHYEEVLRVPLIVRVPRAPAKRVRGLAELVDVAPTVLDLLGLPAAPSMQGRSLVEAGLSATAPRVHSYSGLPYNLRPQNDLDRKLFSRFSLCETVRDERWKLVHERIADRPDSAAEPDESESETWELFDLLADPEEKHDRSKDEPKTLVALRERLAAWREQSLARRRKGAPGAAAIPAELMERARERGYWE